MSARLASLWCTGGDRGVSLPHNCSHCPAPGRSWELGKGRGSPTGSGPVPSGDLVRKELGGECQSDPFPGPLGWSAASQTPSVFQAEVGSGMPLSSGLGHTPPGSSMSPESLRCGPSPALCQAEGPSRAGSPVLWGSVTCAMGSSCTQGSRGVPGSRRALNRDLTSLAAWHS